jgi:hypothetical protein
MVIVANLSLLCVVCTVAWSQSDSKNLYDLRCTANSQGTDTAPDPHASAAADHATVVCIGPKQVRSLEPPIELRWFRASQIEYQLSEQPAFVVADLSGQSQVIANPQKYLSQYTFPFLGSELVPNASNLASIVAVLYNSDPSNGDASNTDISKKKILRLDKRLCKKPSSVLDCLVSGSNFWERLMAGVSGNASLAQRDEVQQGIELTGLPTSISYGPGGEIDFDPSSLFITGSNWQSVLTALKGVKLDVQGKDVYGKEADCFVNNSSSNFTAYDCVKEFAAPRLNPQYKSRTGMLIAAELIPKFQFKVTDQFDFIKNGGVLVAEPGLQRSLKNYTFTWDLRHVIPSTSDRVAAFKAFKALQAKQPPAPPQPSEVVKQPKVCVTISDAGRGYVPVENEFTTERCRSLANDTHAGSFALACATASNIVIGSPNNVGPGIENVNLPTSNACNWDAGAVR